MTGSHRPPFQIANGPLNAEPRGLRESHHMALLVRLAEI